MLFLCSETRVNYREWPGRFGEWAGPGKDYMSYKTYLALMGRTRASRVRFATDPAGAGNDAGAGDGNGGGSGGSEGNGGSGGNDPAGSGGDPKPVSFDDFLKTGSNQAEFDRRVNKAIETAKEKWNILMDDKVSEAEKLAKMNAAEKQQYLEQKRQKELDDREAAITKRELMATAKNTLTDKKLPIELADVLVYTDAEACNNSIAAVEKAFNAAVEQAVKERLKGDDPMKKAPDGKEKTMEQEVANALNGRI